MTRLDAGPGWELWSEKPSPEYLKGVDLVTKTKWGWFLEWWS
jgi:hypothetical protein